MQMELFNKTTCEQLIIDIEEWRECPNFPTHEVSSLGRFRHRKTLRFLSGSDHDCGYRNIGFSVNGKIHTKLAHRLVALAFIEQPHGCNEVNHKNKDRQDNRVSNLEWVNRSQNSKHSWKGR
jgi:hypothetical protein